MNWIFSLQKSISKLIYAGYTGSKNPVRNRLKIQFVEHDFSNLIFQKSSTGGQGNRQPNFYLFVTLENHIKFKINIIDFRDSFHHCAAGKCHPPSSSEPVGLCSAQMCIIKEIDLFNSLLTERSIFSFLFTFWYIKLYTKLNRNVPSKLLD